MNMKKSKKKKLSERTFAEEFLLAEYEGRCPRCIYCGKELTEIKEIQDIDLHWQWDNKKKRYVKGEGDGCSNKPYTGCCEAKDWDLTNNNLASY